jgi:hypothetical protein
MVIPTITCPHCNQEFPLTEVLEHQYRETLEAELKRKIDADHEKTLEHLRVDYEQQLADSKQKTKDAQAAELEFRKQRAAFEEEQEEWELNKQRELDAEKAEIQKKAVERLLEDHQLKDKENDERTKGLIAQINDLKQRAEQGSQQLQGEALELILEDIIRTKFPRDEIIPVPKGVSGADILQKVFDDFGEYCGAILWETKRTKTWGNDWCNKLKKDQITAKADIAILVSKALPKAITSFGHTEGIWITEHSYAHGLVVALRSGLIQTGVARRNAENKGEKIDRLYDYLSSTAFLHQIESVVKSFQTMQEDLDNEKNAMKRIWKKREKQIEQVTEGTLEIIGSLQGIMGKQMPQIHGLELHSLVAGTNELVD